MVWKTASCGSNGESWFCGGTTEMSEAPVLVVAAEGQDSLPLPEGIVVVRDAVGGRGPLQGIEAGLEAIAPQASLAFVSAVDAPFLHPALIRRLVELCSADHDIVAPRV